MEVTISGSESLYMTPEGQASKGQNRQIRCHGKSVNVYIKENMDISNLKVTSRIRKVFANHISEEKFASKTWKALLKPNNKIASNIRGKDNHQNTT